MLKKKKKKRHLGGIVSPKHCINTVYSEKGSNVPSSTLHWQDHIWNVMWGIMPRTSGWHKAADFNSIQAQSDNQNYLTEIR